MRWLVTARRFAAACRTGAIAVAPVLVLVLAGCSDTVGYSEGTGDRTAGKQLFIQNCGSCHRLADAGTQGEIGPDLDAAFYESRRNGLGESTIVQVVRGQIAYPVTTPGTGAPGMPANIVTGDDAENVTAYVASVAGTVAPESVSGGAPPAPGGGGDDADDGQGVFTEAGCGNCHTLSAAGSSGNVGPNLDDAMPDEALVVDRVTNGQGGMPSFEGQLTEEQIAAVAKYVSTSAGT
jgi:mono/diheme cytochrome c family protein